MSLPHTLPDRAVPTVQHGEAGAEAEQRWALGGLSFSRVSKSETAPGFTCRILHVEVCVAEKTMGDVKSIEKAVEALPPSELAEFRLWFAEFDAAAWDKQIEQDAASGKLDDLASEAHAVG